MIDSHAHVDFPQFDRDRPEVLERARQAGVVTLVNPGADVSSSRRAVELAERHDWVWAAVGIHPHSAAEWPEAESVLRELVRSLKVVAIGETGLDYYRQFCLPDIQKEALVGHIRLAREVGLPLIVHCREAYADLFPLLERERADEVGGVMHCFGGDRDAAARAIDLGFFLGVAGSVTFPNAQRLREVLPTVPAERLLLETDCPYLAPVPWRGKRNEPAYLVKIAEAVAAARGWGFAEASAATAENARHLFRLP